MIVKANDLRDGMYHLYEEDGYVTGMGEFRGMWFSTFQMARAIESAEKYGCPFEEQGITVLPSGNRRHEWSF